MDIIKRTSFAMENYMLHNPEKTEQGHRCFFIIKTVPTPSFSHCQWDDGDCASRALDSWLFAREITGDRLTGKDVEDGQWAYLKNLIKEEIGLFCVADHSKPNMDGYYYHMWDQAMALRHLVSRYKLKKEERPQVLPMIEKTIDGCLAFAEMGKEIFWESDTYFNKKAVVDKKPFGRYSYLNFTFVCGLLLAPVCEFYAAKGEKKYLELSVGLAEGFVGGYEKRRESKTPMFDDNGGFYGHVHCSLSSVVGLAMLAKELYLKNDDRYKKYLEIAIKAYKWVFSEDNNSRGSSAGFIMENFGKNTADGSEICCTADIIELARQLAEVSEIIPGYGELDELWDHVDRFTVNELFSAQTMHPERLKKYCEEGDLDAVAEKFRGGWIFGHQLPHDFARISETGCAGISAEGGGATKKEPTLAVGGCCLYSGVRGFYSYWKSIVDFKEKKVEIRFAGRFKNNVIDMAENPGGGIAFTLSEDKEVLIRIPQKTIKNSVRVMCGEKEIPFGSQGGRIVFDGKKGEKYTILWEDALWTSRETLGIANDGRVKSEPQGKRITYTLTYRGNKLESFSPQEGAEIPYFDGL